MICRVEIYGWASPTVHDSSSWIESLMPLILAHLPANKYLKNLVVSVFQKWHKHHTPMRCGGYIKFWSRRMRAALLEKIGFTVGDFHVVGPTSWLCKSMMLVAKSTQGS